MGSEFEVKETFDPDIRNCFIPYSKYEYMKGDKIWFDSSLGRISNNKTCGKYLNILKLQDDGKSSAYPHIDLNGKITSLPYSETINYLTKKEQGYELNKNLFVSPYDWRKDVALSVSGLDTMIDNILATSSAGTKVQIIAHSMGGMLAHQYISDVQRAQKVDTFVELGTPHVGTPVFLAHLLYDKCIDSGIFGVSCIVHGKEVNSLVQNFTGAFELLPSKQYFQLYPDVFPFRDDRDIDDDGVTGALTYDQMKNLLSHMGKNMTIFDMAQSFHDAMDPAYTNTHGVKTYTIAGSGFPTMGQIRDYAVHSVFADGGRPQVVKVIKQDAVAVNGDSTVPLKSVTLDKQEHIYYTKQKHFELPTGNALMMTVQLLNGKTDLVSGIQTTPFTFSGMIIGIYSPTDLHAYDSQGRHTGQTDDGPEEMIPGSLYDQLGEEKFIHLPEGGQYRIMTQATAKGAFDLKVKTYTNGALVKETMFLNVAQTEHTTASMTLSPDAPVLAIDKDNDGNADIHMVPTSIVSGGALTDNRAPESAVQKDGTKGDDGWFRSDVTVTIHAQDDQSGILRTEYVLDDGSSVQTYTQPFVIKKEGKTKMLYYSVDNSGNTEKPTEMEIAIDKTPPELFVGFNPEKKQLQGTGEDTLSGINTILQTDTDIAARDKAGNTTQFDIIAKKDNTNEKKGNQNIVIQALRYNGLTTAIPEVTLSVSWKTDKQNAIDHLMQTFVIKEQEKIHAVYNDNRDGSMVIEKTVGEKTERLKLPGIQIVIVKSAEGKLSLELQ